MDCKRHQNCQFIRCKSSMMLKLAVFSVSNTQPSLPRSIPHILIGSLEPCSMASCYAQAFLRYKWWRGGSTVDRGEFPGKDSATLSISIFMHIVPTLWQSRVQVVFFRRHPQWPELHEVLQRQHWIFGCRRRCLSLCNCNCLCWSTPLAS